MKIIHNIYTVKNHLPIETVHNLESIATTPGISIQTTQVHNLYDAYQIRIKKDYTIHIAYGNERSKDYAYRTLKHLIVSNQLQTGLIEDGPDVKMRGIIEGFYGEPWTHEDRLDMISFLNKERMNTYFYAPKDDEYHRAKWREPYPEKEFSELIELIEAAQKNKIDFYFSISPGNDFNFTKQADFAALFDKLKAVIHQGVTNVSLLLDDIDYSLKDDDLKQFETPGKAHAYICNQVDEYLTKNLKQYNLVMCPTEYWQNYNTPYRTDLKQHLHPNIAVFWTGYNTIAEFIPNNDGENVLSYFGHDLVLWDNYPVNDATKDLLFMGPLVNRGDKLHTTHKGMVSNPMIQWSLSKIPIMTMADYMWNTGAYDSESSYEDAVVRFAKNKQWVEPLFTVLENFRYSILSYDTNAAIEQAIKDEDIAAVVQYYQTFIKAIDTLKDFPNKRFIEQFEPWFKRARFDFKLVMAMNEGNDQEIQRYTKQLEEQQVTVGTNFAAKLAKQLGYYDKKIYKKYRHNFWEDLE